jgi:hypothetical protein
MDLPESVQEIADVIGRERALYLIGQIPQCGKRSWRVNLYVPQRLKPDHQLVQILGWQDAQRMVREFGGMILQPSNCNHLHRRFRNATIHRLAADGQSIQDIAESVQLTARQVRNILAEKPPEETPPANDNTAPIMDLKGVGNL